MAKKEETPFEEMTPEQKKAYMNEEVEYEIMYGEGKYAEDVIVGVNGKFWQIQRGERVRIPRYVAAVLDNSKDQDRMTDRALKARAREYDRKAKAIQA